MKKTAALILLSGMLTLPAFPQTDQQQAIVTNISVPVRVLENGVFVEGLTMEDFELYDKGHRQRIDAVYLIRKKEVQHQETGLDYMPQLNRDFFLLFQMTNYNARLNEAIDYFFDSVFSPGDSLTIMTAEDRYTLSPNALETKSGEQLAKELKNLIRRDTMTGQSSYNSLLRELKRLVATISTSQGMSSASEEDVTNLELLFPRYKENLEKMEQLRVIDEQSFLQFASSLKNRTGQKYVFFFYEREFRPELNAADLSRMMSEYQEKPQIIQHLQDIFQMYSRTPTMDAQRINRAFGDSSISFNLIFINREPELEPGIVMREQSEDIFSSFSDVAKSTGGVVESSMDPTPAFKKAVDIAESYYLIYYTPGDYRENDEYHDIRVFIKDKEYEILHRPGYFARR
jgi:VWFA-related protein